MAVHFSTVAPRLLEFLKALGFELEESDSLLWGRRLVAGENVQVAFHYVAAPERELREATRVLQKAGRSEPGAKLYVLTSGQVRQDQVEHLSDIDVTVTSEAGYFSAAIQATATCHQVLAEAEAYIPERDYIGQTLAPNAVSAVEFLRKWVTTADTGMLVVLAPAGHGKTCLANQLARELANDYLRDSSRPVPFLLPLHRHRHVRRFEELVLTHLQDLGIHGFTSAGFAFLLNVHRLVLVLDGFDELAETGGIRVARDTLRGLIHQLSPEAKVLVTSRQAYFRHRGDLSLVGSEAILDNLQTRELEPFDESRRLSFLQRRGLDRTQIKEIEQWVRGMGAEELLASPLMLKILADETKAGTQIRGSSAAEMFDLSLRRICQREEGKGAFQWSVDRQLELLSTVADLMHQDNAHELDADWLVDVVAPDAPADLPSARRKEAVTARAVQFKNHPLLVGFVINGMDAVTFPHHLYRDFFIARAFTAAVRSRTGVRNALRAGLPDASAGFLADLLTDQEVVELLSQALDWGEDLHGAMQVILAKCDKVSKQDQDKRTEKMLQCVGKNRRFDTANLSRLRFNLLTFDGFSFVGTGFTNSVFQSCAFYNCDFSSAQLAGCRVYECTADTKTAALLETQGIRLGKKDQHLLKATTVRVANSDPVTELVTRFFRRFLRDERGKHQRTAKKDSMVAGLGGEERKFTEREVVPEMLKRGIIDDQTRGVDVYEFNSSWQQDGDDLIWEARTSERLGAIIERLQVKAGRYGLV